MKTILSIFLISSSTIIFGQGPNGAPLQQSISNLNYNNVSIDNNPINNGGNEIYQIQSRNVVNLNNNIGNLSNTVPQNQFRNNRGGDRSNRGRGAQTNKISNSNRNVNPSANEVAQVPQVPQVPQVVEQQVVIDNGGNLNNELNFDNVGPNINVNPNININVPKVNLSIPKVDLNLSRNKENKVEKETKSTKSLDDFRIKTGGGSSGVSHQYKNKKRSTGKKIKKSVRCWWNKHFTGEIKFKVSCDCFRF